MTTTKKGQMLHKKSNVFGRVPSASTLGFGEIAVNYNEKEPFLAIKTSGETNNFEVVKISSDKIIEQKINDAVDKVGLELNELADIVSQNELVTAESLTELNDAINYIDSKFSDYATSAATSAAINAVNDKVDALSDTVVKTTPQTLSEGDKNQVKENLGISTPDWNANEGEAGYIKNKPFGVVFKAVNWFYDDSANYCITPMISNKVKYEGVIYEIPDNDEEWVSLGDGSIALSKYPYYDSNLMYITSLGIQDESDERLQNILFEVNTKLDEKFIPDTIARKSDIELVKISYSDLKSLRDKSQLAPGQQYRITDYVTTAKSVDKSILATACEISVENHAFDIIVTADDVNVLNENVRAIQHTNDENDYFRNSNLASWELKYCIDNDINRFMWADVDEGKGCIYFMKDEFDNECSYDFKNIKFKYNDAYYYTFHDVDTDGDASLNNMYCYSNIIEPNNPWGKYNLNGNIFTIGTNSYCYGNIFGPNCINIIIDSQGSGSFNNHFGHTCKDIVLGLGNYKNTFGDGCKNIVFGENCYKNFIDVNGTNITFGKKCNDNTINGNVDNIIFSESCVGNTIGMRNSTIEFGKNCNVNVIECYSKKIKMGDNCEANRIFGGENNKYCQKINIATGSRYNTVGLCFNNSLADTAADSIIDGNSNTVGKMCNNVNINGTYNIIDDNCQKITLANNSKYNTVKSQCSDISMTKSLYNTIGKNCSKITFQEECNSNTFGNNCTDNSFGFGCSEIGLGNYCTNNIFGDSCYSNIFGDYCYHNIFAENCSYNSFGVGCQLNSFGNGCNNNSFGNRCDSNSFGDECYSNSFGDVCSSNSFGNGCYSNSFSNNCDYNNFGEVCSSNNFREGCNCNSFGVGCTSNSFGVLCRYNSLGNNCDYNDFGGQCYSNSFDNDCSYNSFGDYCSSNSLGNDCEYNRFGDYCFYNSFGNKCRSNSFGESKDNLKSYYRNIIFDNGNRYINLNCTTTRSTSKYYQNVRIGLGVNNTDTYKTINDSNVGQTYETLYKPANSQTITI